MQIIRDIAHLQGKSFPHVAAAVGTFDGVHAGHQRIIRTVVERARQTGGTGAALTFIDHPLRILQPNRAPSLITPSPLKERLLNGMGVDLLIAVPFTASLAGMEAEAFVEEILWKALRVEFLCIGFDFHFGKGRRGTSDLLKRMGEALGFAVEVVPPIAVEGTVVKSGLIRDLLHRGKVGEAARYLTRPYAIAGEIVPGAGRGRDLGFSTANVVPPQDFLIPDGVYAGRAYAGERGYDAAINVGVAPTFGRRGRRVEVHLLDVGEDGVPGYGQAVLVTFWERIREEIRFASPEELKAQVARDIRRAREVLRQSSSPAPADWPLLGIGSCVRLTHD
ncbi:MAG: bifunctional riboflavin kinase/FAD synthetase [Candidatus Methylomirabilales bacterium]